MVGFKKINLRKMFKLEAIFFLFKQKNLKYDFIPEKNYKFIIFASQK